MTWFDRDRGPHVGVHAGRPGDDGRASRASTPRTRWRRRRRRWRSACRRDAVVQGLKTFVQDPERNPGRANLFELDGRIVMIDYAHNEAGIVGHDRSHAGAAAAGAARSGWRSARLAIGAIEILHAFGFRAAVGSDHLAIAELEHYLRGRTARGHRAALAGGGRQGRRPRCRTATGTSCTALEGMLDARRSPAMSTGVTALSMRPGDLRLARGTGRHPYEPRRRSPGGSPSAGPVSGVERMLRATQRQVAHR